MSPMTVSSSHTPKLIMGLTQAQAAERLAHYGANELRPKKRWSALRRLVEVLSEPTLLVLVLVLVLYLLMGSRGEAGLLGVFVAIVISVTWVEEGRTAAAVGPTATRFLDFSLIDWLLIFGELA